jgi:hypothetical protein
MITVHYKPFEALRPVHIVVLTAAEAELSPSELPAIFGLPELVLQHASDDLVRWGLASSINGQVGLLPGGARCVSFWGATEQRGFWSFSEPDGWNLGKGVFFFRSPLSRLADAGLDPETGSVLSQEDATARQSSFLIENEKLEREIQAQSASRDLQACVEAGGDQSKTIAGWLERPRTRLHLNQLCRMMRTALDYCESDNDETRGRVHHAYRCIDEQREQAERRLRDEQRSMQPVQEVLIAKWLSERTGLLHDLAEADPLSILIRSDFEAVTPVSSFPSRMKKPTALANAQQLDFGDHSSSTITTKAWGALNEKNFYNAVAYAKKCVEMYEKQAVEMQKGLTSSVAGERDAVSKMGALNDVGTCLFIMGQALEKQDKGKDALAAYRQLVKKVPFAQCWDSRGWFWKPSDAAKGCIKALESDTMK